MSDRLAIAVLARGRSTRMGRDKSFVELNEQGGFDGKQITSEDLPVAH
jgi:molybdopterin-guanine dinucleotide biosynthesis protein A